MAVYILLFIIVFGEGLLISSMGAVVFVLTLTGCERDDRNKTDLLWNSLPIARWKIVAAKYLSSLAYALLTIPVYWLISVAFSRSSLAIAPISGADLVSGLGMAMLLVGLTLPVFFCLGLPDDSGLSQCFGIAGAGCCLLCLAARHGPPHNIFSAVARGGRAPPPRPICAGVNYSIGQSCLFFARCVCL